MRLHPLFLVTLFALSCNSAEKRSQANATMFSAVRADNLPKLKNAIKAGADVNAPGNMGESALYEAAERGYKDMFIFLKSVGAQDRYAIHTSVHLRNISELKKNIQAGMDINGINHQSRTPLDIAVALGDANLVNELIALGAKDDDPVNTAVCLRDTQMLKEAIKKGANVNGSGTRNETPLIIAAENGYIDAAKILVNAGARLDERDRTGNTAIIIGAFNGHTDVVKLLIKSKADLNAAAENGMTPLMGAAENGHLSIVKILLKVGVNLSAQDSVGRTAHDLATSFGHVEIVRLLSEAR